jgi:hypothetical protein
LLLVPFVDFTGRGGAARGAAEKLGVPLAKDAPANHVGGWLQLPWPDILTGSGTMPATAFQPEASTTINIAEFRHYFITGLLRHLVLWTWWLGAPLGAWLIHRAGGQALDLFWGAVAGAVAGLIASATLACLLIAFDLVPHTIWAVIGSPSGVALLPVWSLLAILCWGLIGAGLFLLAWLIPGSKRLMVTPAQHGLARLLPARFIVARLVDERET